MPPTKGKQGTRGKKQIAEENQQTLKMYIYIIAAVNIFYYPVWFLFFWDKFSTLPLMMSVLISLIYLASYQFMASMGKVTYHNGQLVDPGTDLNMQAGMAEHTKDIILLSAIVQILSLISNYFWFLLLVAPARVIYMLWVNFLGPWFFAPAEEEQVDEKKAKKMERKMRRQQIVR